MATTTPNFGWSVPTSTDYVKDGATAIETLGDAIDASLVDLKGGTTGQVLSKNTNTDMDFTWVTPNDADAIQNTIVDAKGDVITATGADVPARLAVGTNGQVLTADSTTATGLKWATPAAGAFTKITSNTFSAVTSVSFPNDTFTTTYDDYFVLFTITASSANGNVTARLRAAGTDNTTSTYNYIAYGRDTLGNNIDRTQSGGTYFDFGYANGGFVLIPLYVSNPKASQKTLMASQFESMESGGSRIATYMGAYNFNATTSFDAMSFIMGSGNFTGRYAVYGLEK